MVDSLQEAFPAHLIAFVQATQNYDIVQYCRMGEKASFPIIHVYHQGKNMMEITQPKSIYDIQIIINVMVAEQEMKAIINKFRGD